MRTPGEQDEFLAHGRFGEGEQSIKRLRVDRAVWLGLSFVAAGCACLGAIWLFDIGGHDVEGLDLLYGAVLFGSIGFIAVIVGLVRSRGK